MRISIIQYEIKWEDRLSNFRIIEEFASELNHKTDLVILPEMFTTGFSMNPERLHEKPQSDTYVWMQRIAAEGNFGICGSYIVGDNGNFYNRWVLVTPDGKSQYYDKRHLFMMTGEEKAFTPGNKREIIKFGEVRICPNVCYDLRFPVWSRNKNDYDLLLNSANWPEARNDVWITLLRARAIENQCFVAGANRTGYDGAGIKHCGNSMIINPKGEVIALAEENKECIITADISIKELLDFRKKFPVLKDADNFIINTTF